MCIRDRSKEYKKAEEAFEAGISLLKDLKILYDQGVLLYEYGKYFKEKGDRKRAREKLNEALSIFEEIGSESFIDKVKSELTTL